MRYVTTLCETEKHMNKDDCAGRALLSPPFRGPAAKAYADYCGVTAMLFIFPTGPVLKLYH